MTSYTDFLGFFMLALLVGLFVGYWCGHRDGLALGCERGATEEMRRSRARAIRYKIESFRAGMAEAVRKLSDGGWV
jgi:hypothetical protein